MENFLEVNQVTKRYANHLALDAVSISIPRQSIYGLLGPNGAGKTSLIRIINQITGPDSGSININGQPLKPHHIGLIGYLPEERGLYKKMKVGEQAIYLAQLKGVDKATAKKRLQEWFEKFEIENWWNRKVEELSKGMQQKIQFAVTIVHQPELLIFDEPFSGFDPINVNLLKAEILALRKAGATVVFSTHNMASVEELCDDIALINKGKKIVEGKMHDIRMHYKSNIFEVILQDLDSVKMSQLSDNFNVQKTEQLGENIQKLNIQADAEAEHNALLRQMLAIGKVISFREVLPSMNDIFIQLVQSQNTKPNGSA